LCLLLLNGALFVGTVEKKEMRKRVCPLIKMGISPSDTGLGSDIDRKVIDACLKCKFKFCLFNNGRKPGPIKSDKATKKVYQCLSCKDIMTLYFEDGRLETVKEVAPRQYRGSRRLQTRPAGKYVQKGGGILHKHIDGLHLCQEIKRRVK